MAGTTPPKRAVRLAELRSHAEQIRAIVSRYGIDILLAAASGEVPPSPTRSGPSLLGCPTRLVPIT